MYQEGMSCFTCGFDPLTVDRGDLLTYPVKAEDWFTETQTERAETIHVQHDGAHEPHWVFM